VKAPRWSGLGLIVCLAAAQVTSAAEGPQTPPFCAEWIRQSKDAYERVTLFSDGTLVWKRRAAQGTEDLKRKTMASEELKFYCDYFARPEFWKLPDDFRTKLNAEFVHESQVTITREHGERKTVRFDELSTLSLDALSLKAALEGLRTLFVRTIAPASKFTPETLEPGTALTRLDGATFRVRMIDKARGVVELEGVSEPFSFFGKIEELRFLFEAPATSGETPPTPAPD
jgi:hypothetical protein